ALVEALACELRDSARAGSDSRINRSSGINRSGLRILLCLLASDILGLHLELLDRLRQLARRDMINHGLIDLGHSGRIGREFGEIAEILIDLGPARVNACSRVSLIRCNIRILRQSSDLSTKLIDQRAIQSCESLLGRQLLLLDPQ